MESDILGRIPWTFTHGIRDCRSSFKNQMINKACCTHTHTSRNKYLSAYIMALFFPCGFVCKGFDITLLKQLRTGFYSVFYHALDATCTLADMDVVQELGLGVLGLAGNLVVRGVVSL